eukprot:TRINITY_DN406_c0_g1_i5.p1 TRINITY_DN406_c0_g1~~TRINITY_DN406_c0_g1_i5.p1  ORF type:complete len:124 (-),score=31.66 TRINITY_DN406_c0_g1_i5:165-536(-)
MLHITHVLNATRDVPNYFEAEGKVKYLRADVDDLDETTISHCFEEVAQFLDEVLDRPSYVAFIHCKIGKSRSAAFAIMFLMKRYKWTYEESFSYMKNRRDFIYPNPGFVLQLEAYERRLRNSE